MELLYLQLMTVKVIYLCVLYVIIVIYLIFCDDTHYTNYTYRQGGDCYD